VQGEGVVLYIMAQLVGALCYKLEGCGFNSQWGHWDFSLTYLFQLHCGSGVDSALTAMSTRNFFWGKGGQCIELITLPPSCTICFESQGASTFWSPKAFPGL